MEAVIFVGIQGVGKSTFYQQRFADTHVRINLDLLKTRQREKLLLEACIAAQQSFVVDNTNPRVADRARYIVPAKAAGFRVIGYYFESSLREALTRNRQRSPSSVVPDKAISATQRRLQTPRMDEGFDALYGVTLNASNEFVVRAITSSEFLS